ncbi:MAG: rRNA maturation RNAse YbeY, partial [Lentisphaerae bacterium]|nr:rRNA maturation RNAse YbeY [Lentisphaerota bacterium]
GDHGMYDGEVIVNVQRALENIDQKRVSYSAWTSSDELALYIAHGYDHLSGEDDTSAENAARMRRRELRWLRIARKNGLLEKLI